MLEASFSTTNEHRIHWSSGGTELWLRGKINANYVQCLQLLRSMSTNLWRGAFGYDMTPICCNNLSIIKHSTQLRGCRHRGKCVRCAGDVHCCRLYLNKQYLLEPSKRWCVTLPCTHRSAPFRAYQWIFVPFNRFIETQNLSQNVWAKITFKNDTKPEWGDIRPTLWCA